MKIVICGFGSAGYGALLSIKRTAPKAQITIIDPKAYDLIHTCGLPYSLEGIVAKEDLLQNINLKSMGVEKIRGIIKFIDRYNKKIIYLTQEGEFKENYDKLLIATGYTPLIPSIKGLKEHFDKSLFSLTNTKDLNMIINKLELSYCGSVIGAGTIGLETAFALKNNLKEISIIESKNQVLPGFIDSDVSKIVEKYIIDSGIQLYLNERAEEISGTSNLESIKTSNLKIKSDIAILATGFLPNISLAKISNLEICENGIMVNEFLQTSDPDIFAAGDCIAGWSRIDSSLIKTKLATSAYKQGILAGANIASKDIFQSYRGSTGTFVTKFGKLEVAGTGFSTEIALEKGFEPVVGKISTHIQPNYFPNNTEITLKIIFDKKTNMILGAQAVGEKGTAERINIISAAIEFDININELGKTEIAYCPAISDVYDPLLRAIDFGIRRVKNNT